MILQLTQPYNSTRTLRTLAEYLRRTRSLPRRLLRSPLLPRDARRRRRRRSLYPRRRRLFLLPRSLFTLYGLSLSFMHSRRRCVIAVTTRPITRGPGRGIILRAVRFGIRVSNSSFARRGLAATRRPFPRRSSRRLVVCRDSVRFRRHSCLFFGSRPGPGTKPDPYPLRVWKLTVVFPDSKPAACVRRNVFVTRAFRGWSRGLHDTSSTATPRPTNRPVRD